MKIASLQYPIRFFNHKREWQDSILFYVEEACKNQAHLLVFPEYGSMNLCSLIDNHSEDLAGNKKAFDASFSENSLAGQLKSLQSFLPEFRSFFSEVARKFSIYILAPSFPVADSGKYINRAFF
ncbi:MAG: hypothetical protein L6Q37_12670, partial [Bdellovibrionaceae bacterium]|nr:hypothetical protein [Pseudobdellovibrionaceae bacterium]